MKLLTAHSSLVQQPIRWMGCFCFFSLLTIPLKAQLQVSDNYAKREGIRLETSIVCPTSQLALSKNPEFLHKPLLKADGIWLPEYARENPAGHAPLCRIETGLENRMRVPLWIKAGGTENIPQFGTGNLYLRMKLLRF